MVVRAMPVEAWKSSWGLPWLLSWLGVGTGHHHHQMRAVRAAGLSARVAPGSALCQPHSEGEPAAWRALPRGRRSGTSDVWCSIAAWSAECDRCTQIVWNLQKNIIFS